MHGIKPHSHQDRADVISQLIPLLKKTYGDNFVALAADGSFARGEDVEFSDLELIAFLNEIPPGVDLNIHSIVGGLQVVIDFETKQSFIQKYFDIVKNWHASAAGRLLPLINSEFIESINSFVPVDIEKKCLDQIVLRWPAYQEITAKLLNFINQKNKEALPIVFPVMLEDILTILSFINQTPYVTMGSRLSQAKNFLIRPKGFDELVQISVNGTYSELQNLKQAATDVFEELENFLEKKGYHLNIDHINELEFRT